MQTTFTCVLTSHKFFRFKILSIKLEKTHANTYFYIKGYKTNNTWTRIIQRPKSYNSKMGVENEECEYTAI